MTIAKYYQPDTGQCVDVDENVIVDLSPVMIGLNFKILVREKVLVKIEEESISIFVKNASNHKRHINEAWIEEPRKTGL